MPQSQLLDPVTRFTRLEGMNASTLALVTERAVGLLAARWQDIHDAAHDEANGGKITVRIGIDFDFTAKCPAGNVTLAFVPSRIKDEADFRVEDPDQTTLPLQEAMQSRRRRPDRTEGSPNMGGGSR